MTTKKHNSKSKRKRDHLEHTRRPSGTQYKKIPSTLQPIKVQCLEPRFTKYNSTINLRLCKSRLSFLGRMALQLGKIGKGSHLSLWPRLRWLQRTRGLWYSVKRCLCIQLRSSILNRVAEFWSKRAISRIIIKYQWPT